MAESGRIAARGLRGTFWRIVAGAGFSQSLYHRYHMPPRRTRVSQGRAPAISHSLPAFVAGLDATEEATIAIVND
jgi:hypothetical protein